MMMASAVGAHALRIVGEQAPKEAAVRGAGPAGSSASNADDSAVLREGEITALSADGSRVQIQGTWLKVLAGKTKFYRRGSPVNAQQLQKGAKVKYTLGAGAVDQATLGVVYVP